MKSPTISLDFYTGRLELQYLSTKRYFQSGLREDLTSVSSYIPGTTTIDAVETTLTDRDTILQFYALNLPRLKN